MTFVCDAKPAANEMPLRCTSSSSDLFNSDGSPGLKLPNLVVSGTQVAQEFN